MASLRSSDAAAASRPLRAAGGRGSLGPLSRLQAAALEAAVLLGVLSVTTRRPLLAVAGLVTAALLIAGLVFPIRGRTPLGWLRRFWWYRRGFRLRPAPSVSAADK